MKNFGNAVSILETLEERGYEAYFVGGCVRDYILGQTFSDIDIATNALPSEVKKFFRKTIDTGIEHGTVTVVTKKDSYEVTTFRTESDYSNHRSPDKVEFVRNLKDDLDRRDFTINAMAMDSKGRLYDFHSGRVDLEKKVIRTVNDPNERFYEDALRMLRAFRFAAKLDFVIDEKTFLAIKKNAELIKYVSIERIVTEFRKLLAGAANEKSLALLIESSINNYIPFLKDIKEYRDFSRFTFAQSLFYLAYFNDIELSELKKLKLSNKEVKKVKTYFSIKSEFDNDLDFRVILYNYDKEDVAFVAEVFSFADSEAVNTTLLVIDSFDDVDISTKEIIEIVDRKPGPWVKELVAKLEEEIIFEKIKNDKQEIVDFLLKIRDNI